MSTSTTAAPPGVHRPDPVRPRRRTLRRPEMIAAYLFVAPFFVVFLAMVVAPLVYSGYLSLFREQLVGRTVWVGLGNYADALADPEFLGGVLRVLRFFAIQVPVMLGLAVLFALVLDSGRLRLQRFVRLSIFVPYAVPSVIAALMWGYLYGPDFGPFAQLAEAVGASAPQFLSDRWALASIANIVTWGFVGYNMIILYAALRSVPTELYEAARIDGANEARIAWSVKLPTIRPALLLTLIFSVIGSLQLFNEPNLLRNLAPNVIGAAYTPNLYAYNLAFVNQEINYSAAIAFLLGLVIMIVSYVVQLGSQRRERRS
ncbi:carbohydrate ABC transporter permease [Cellulomonas shaoxiangyii]|uniref:Sugar ABC transporter permease n=1 Tax=Cellulomonas shaoxiangyii TaxID=2566013 RepID=A0A4P7SFP0_9CELL|nr:sugar ABC transporter permease [Cellulomonas shaoxiangyii]QCB92999.1 sugar ABC transporter permease [Cellulomonas shaoxiangyii]TGY85584.1 sugar ABC transporter permease [Cellulomonas shaoxiangyii]